MSEEVRDPADMTEDELEAQLMEEPPTVILDRFDEEPEGSDEESPDTDTETAADEELAPDTDTETAEESTEETVDPVLAAFKEQGLDKTYATPAAALQAHKEAQAEIGRLRREQADRERQTVSDPVPLEQDDHIFDDPEQAIRDLASEVQRLKAESMTNQLNATIARNPGLETEQAQAEVANVIRTDSILNYLYGVNPSWAVTQAWDRIRATKPVAPSEPAKPQFKPVSDDVKANATTSSGGSAPKRTRKALTADDWAAKSEKELEAEIGFGE